MNRQDEVRHSMKVQVWELHICEDGQHDASHHRTEALAWEAVFADIGRARAIREWLQGYEYDEIQPSCLTEDQRTAVGEALASASIDVTVESFTIDTEEFDAVNGDDRAAVTR
jgi:hypothetical protein